VSTVLEVMERPAQQPVPAASEAKSTAHEKLVIFAWSGDLDRVWPTLILATTAAASGMATTVFFTFWGLFPLVREDRRITGKNMMQKMLAVMNRGGIDYLKLSKLQMFGAGSGMMKVLAKQHQVASPAELLASAIELGVKLIPCQMTMDLMGLTTADLIEGIEEPAGAMTAMLDAKDAVTLFI
jgi:peroxiredoxin family protein